VRCSQCHGGGKTVGRVPHHMCVAVWSITTLTLRCEHSGTRSRPEASTCRLGCPWCPGACACAPLARSCPMTQNSEASVVRVAACGGRSVRGPRCLSGACMAAGHQTFGVRAGPGAPLPAPLRGVALCGGEIHGLLGGGARRVSVSGA